MTQFNTLKLAVYGNNCYQATSEPGQLVLYFPESKHYLDAFVEALVSLAPQESEFLSLFEIKKQIKEDLFKGIEVEDQLVPKLFTNLVDGFAGQSEFIMASKNREGKEIRYMSGKRQSAKPTYCLKLSSTDMSSWRTLVNIENLKAEIQLHPRGNVYVSYKYDFNPLEGCKIWEKKNKSTEIVKDNYQKLKTLKDYDIQSEYEDEDEGEFDMSNMKIEYVIKSDKPAPAAQAPAKEKFQMRFKPRIQVQNAWVGGQYYENYVEY